VAELATSVLRQYDPRIPIGGGTPANFLELNRSRPPVELLDFITWSQNPQVHATDESSMVETLAAHAALIESARQFAGGLPLVVGPITLKPRVNPYATGKWPPAPQSGELPPQVDPRQSSPFAAAWTLGSIKYLAEGGVAAATFYEPVGTKGLMERGAGEFPLYQVFADLAAFPAAEVWPVRSLQPLAVEALAVKSGGQLGVFVANLSPHPQRVALTGAAEPAHRNLELAPHAIAHVDLT
jgi:hypothetical protein